jgi:hypothetical protein
MKTVSCQPVISWDQQELLYSYNKAHKKTKYMKLRGKFQLQDTAVIDTNAVYIFMNRRYYYDMEKPDTVYYFRRFFKNGQYFLSGDFYTIPSDNECNNIDYGKRGYYTIKDSILTTETFDNPYDGYYFSYYIIKEEGLLLFKTRRYKWPFFFSKEKCNTFIPFQQRKRNIKFNTTATW